jgi:hypothetical protein
MAGEVPVAIPSASAEVPGPQRLATVDLEIPPPVDAAATRGWDLAQAGFATDDFKGTDRALAELAKSADVPTRETSRLARAMLWIGHGHAAEVRPVLADLAANATRPGVRQRASELLATGK